MPGIEALELAQGIGLKTGGDDDPPPDSPDSPHSPDSTNCFLNEVATGEHHKKQTGDSEITNKENRVNAVNAVNQDPMAHADTDKARFFAGEEEDDPLGTYLDNPPEWLQTQLARCLEDEAIIKPTCSTVAYEVYGTASRWEEVKPVLERWLAGGGAS